MNSISGEQANEKFELWLPRTMLQLVRTHGPARKGSYVMPMTSLVRLSSIPILWGRESTALNLLNEWAARVVKHHDDFLSNADDDRTWGINDLEGSYFVRDVLETTFRAHGLNRSAVLDAVDGLLLSFTADSEEPSLSALAGAGKNAGWWWSRIPTAGLIHLEYDELKTSTT
jgi:hypothetical protein